MIKLIVSDIDGTLTEDGGSSLDPELYEVILRLKEQGIYFAAASGRHATSIFSNRSGKSSFISVITVHIWAATAGHSFSRSIGRKWPGM